MDSGCSTSSETNTMAPIKLDAEDNTDCETYPPSDNEIEDFNEEVVHILTKMEQLNRANESDARSVASKKSVGSSSESNPSNGRSVHPNCQQDEDDKIVDVWAVWGNLVKSWESEMRKRPTCVKEFVRRGIPQHFRTIVWQLLTAASAASIHDQYSEYLRQSSPYEKVIMRDVNRTFPELEFFKDESHGQQNLFNVIKAYSIHDREVGYCQGSAFIVGMLLLQMPEEEAFAVFVKLMENYRLRELYKPSMAELGLCIFQLECLIQEQQPDLYAHFNNMGFDTSMFASSWFLTLFTTTLSLDLCNRIMDLFLVDGLDAVFRVAMAILQQSKITLLGMDTEGMLNYFKRDLRERLDVDHDLILTIASQVMLNAKKMKKLEKDYLAKKTKEQEENIELRRLRTENRLLRQRIDYLEHESSALADRLVRGQVDLAQQADDCLNISHELHVLREINSDAHRRLEEAYETIRELSSGSKRELGERTTTSTGTQVDDTTMIEHIHSLQQDLIETHSRKADLENSVRELKTRIQDLESSNKRLRESPPDGEVASLQEELIRVKMREAEAALSLKEMRQRLGELEKDWQKYEQGRSSASLASVQSLPNCINEAANGATNNNNTGSPTASTDSASVPQTARKTLAKLTASLMGGGNGESDGTNTPSIRELEDQLMCLRIREADASVELREMRQKVMELETQNHVCSNQLKRQDDELRKIKEERDELSKTEEKFNERLKEEQHKLLIATSEMEEKNVMQRLKYTSALQDISDLKQYIAKLESKNAEKYAHQQLRGTSLVDLDEESIASNRSAGSAAEVNSINSEEMRDFLADVTLRPQNGKTNHINGNSLLDDDTDEEDSLASDTGPKSKNLKTPLREKNC
ncbi:Ecotropic viral integration site 5-like protein [Aphelenchoides besseyi]|nr:Ecotropic viral integration site 5-like protein [Aphelenchoides besseyi]